MEEKPKNIIDLKPYLTAAALKEFNEKFIEKLKQGSTEDKIAAAKLENQNVT